MKPIPNPTPSEWEAAARTLASLYAISVDVGRGIESLRATEHRPGCAVALELLLEAMDEGPQSERPAA